MPSYNKVILMGNLTRDPELRYLPSNMPVVGMGLAVNDRWKDKQTGEWKDKANFIDCEAFGQTAENINKFFTKGKPILIEGKLRLDQWQDKDGNNRSKLKVVIDRFEFVGSRSDGEGGANTSRDSSRNDAAPGSAPAPGSGQTPVQAPGSTPGPSHEPVGDDDIPF